jgi:hypothetical protein
MSNYTSAERQFATNDRSNSTTPPSPEIDGIPSLDIENVQQFAHAAVARARARAEAARAEQAAQTYPELIKRSHKCRRIHSADGGNDLQEPLAAAEIPDATDKTVTAADQWTREQTAQFIEAVLSRARARRKVADAAWAARPQAPRLLKRPRKRRRIRSAGTGEDREELAAAADVPVATAVSAAEVCTREQNAQLAIAVLDPCAGAGAGTVCRGGPNRRTIVQLGCR